MEIIQVVQFIHPGIAGGGEQPPHSFEATRAGLAMALDYADYLRTKNRGSFGNIGGGHTNVFMVSPEGDRTPVYTMRDGAGWPRGILKRDIIRKMEESVWDGNNRVHLLPRRCYTLRRRQNGYVADGTTAF